MSFSCKCNFTEEIARSVYKAFLCLSRHQRGSVLDAKAGKHLSPYLSYLLTNSLTICFQVAVFLLGHLLHYKTVFHLLYNLVYTLEVWSYQLKLFEVVQINSETSSVTSSHNTNCYMLLFIHKFGHSWNALCVLSVSESFKVSSIP